MLGFLIVETKIYTTSLTEFMIVRNVDVWSFFFFLNVMKQYDNNK